MKKLYSLVAIAAISTGAFAQGTESFTNVNASANGYTSGSFVGDNNVTWTYADARKATATDAITGISIGFGTTGTRSVSGDTNSNGVGTLTYSVRTYFTGGVASDRTVEVYVGGVLQESFTLAAMKTTYNRSLNVNKNGVQTIEFRSTGARQLVIDDVSWTASATLAVIEPDSNKINFIKNTVVDSSILFGTAADVKIYSMNGQLVKSANVKSGQSVDVSSLAKGIYIVAGEFDGQKMTRKIIKK